MDNELVFNLNLAFHIYDQNDFYIEMVLSTFSKK